MREKKSSILYILDVLKRYTDKNHSINYSAIIDKLKSNYDIELERKTVARDIDILIDKGFDIKKKGNNGVSLEERTFEEGELLFLVDAIYSSRSIPTKYARDLIGKLTQDYSIYEKDKFRNIEKVDEGVKVDNKQLFYTIEVLNNAIEQGKKVEFQYNVYDIDGKLKPKKEGKFYKVNPYYMANNKAKYYLICNYDKYDNLGNYKIDCISNIRILDEKIKPLKSLPGQENFSLKEYMREHIFMFSGDSVNATIEICVPERINDVVNWFGQGARLYKREDKIYADLTVNEDAIIFWALQYGESVEIISPESTRNKMKNIITKMIDKYSR